VTPAILRARAAGIPFEVHEVALAPGSRLDPASARAAGLPPERIFKTLVAKVDERRLVVAIVPLAAQLDLKKLAVAAGARRAAMATPREAERATGYVVGGISPLGQRRPLPTFLDDAALALPTLFVSGGRRGLELELAPRVLLDVCQGQAVPLARSPVSALRCP
jgi:Cys-tRNA(Pro)/Cys-tRNA(Cys) deacylase